MPTLEAIAIFLAVMVTAYLCAVLLLNIPKIAKIVDEEESQRFAAIDGIRGFLALSVFVHHFAVHGQYQTTGVWIAPKNEFLTMAGAIPVYLFFVITGFLFWSRAIRGGGKIDVRSFAISRFFRIAPMYALVTAIAFFLAWRATNFVFQGDSGETYLAVTRSLTFGAFRIDYFNGMELLPITAGVAWTLVYEWGFYAALPIVSWFAKWPRFPYLAAFFLFLLAFESGFPDQFIADGKSIPQLAALFLIGMIVAHIQDALPKLNFSKQIWPSVTMAILLAASYFTLEYDFATIGFLFLFPIFVGLAYGVDLFGLFSTRPARLLGAASYSIYLIHGPILYLTALGTELKTPFAFFVVAILTVVSVLTYIVIERPMMRLGKRIANPPARVK